MSARNTRPVIAIVDARPMSKSEFRQEQQKVECPKPLPRDTTRSSVSGSLPPSHGDRSSVGLVQILPESEPSMKPMEPQRNCTVRYEPHSVDAAPNVSGSPTKPPHSVSPENVTTSSTTRPIPRPRLRSIVVSDSEPMCLSTAQNNVNNDKLPAPARPEPATRPAPVTERCVLWPLAPKGPEEYHVVGSSIWYEGNANAPRQRPPPVKPKPVKPPASDEADKTADNVQLASATIPPDVGRRKPTIICPTASSSEEQTFITSASTVQSETMVTATAASSTAVSAGAQTNGGTKRASYNQQLGSNVVGYVGVSEGAKPQPKIQSSVEVFRKSPVHDVENGSAVVTDLQRSADHDSSTMLDIQYEDHDLKPVPRYQSQPLHSTEQELDRKIPSSKPPPPYTTLENPVKDKSSMDKPPWPVSWPNQPRATPSAPPLTHPGEAPELPPRPTLGHPRYHHLVQGPHALALFDYTASHPDELSFMAGDVITLESWVNAEWIIGLTDKGHGMFPVNFVKIVEPLPTKATASVGNFDWKQTSYSHSDVKNIPTDMSNPAEDFDDQLSRTIQIENVREDLVDVIELYVEHRKHGGGELEKSPEYDSKRQKLTVIFTDAKVAQHFLRVGTLDVDGEKLPVRPVQREPECEPPIPPSSVILVSWSHVGLKEKILKMYLENQRRSGGGQVKDLRFFAEEKKAYVRFVEESVSGLLYRCPHQLDGHKLTISVVDDTDGIFIGSSSSEAVSCAIELRDLTPDITEKILSMFFQNRKRSGGDRIVEIFYRSEERRAIITFTHPEVVERILEKHSSSALMLRNQQLHISALRPRPDALPLLSRDVDDHRLLFSNLPDSVNTDDFKKYLHRASASPYSGGRQLATTSVTYGIRRGTAMAVFHQPYDFSAVHQLVKQKPYDGVMVGLQQVPRTRSIQVYGVGEITPELLTLHFENFDGVGVADVKPHVDDDYAIVHLTDSTDKKIISEELQGGHEFENHQLKVAPYYECLGPVPPGMGDVPCWTPPVVTVKFDPHIVQFVARNDAMRSRIEASLTDLSPGCVIAWPDSTASDSGTVEISFTGANDSTSGMTVSKKCKERLIKSMDTLETGSIEILHDVWPSFIEQWNTQSPTIADKSVLVQIDADKCSVRVVGERTTCGEIMAKLRCLQTDLVDKLQRSKMRITERIQSIFQHQLSLLESCGFLQTESADDLTVSLVDNVIILEGQPEKVGNQKLKIYALLAQASKESVHVDEYVLTVLKLEPFRRHLDELLQRITGVVWYMDEKKIEVYGENQDKVHHAVSAVKSAFIRKIVELDESESATRKLPVWQELKTMLTTQHSTLVIDETDHSYTITCSAGMADGVLERIQNFFKDNAVHEEFVAASTVGMATVVNNYLKDEITAVCSDFVACNVSVKLVVDDARRGNGFVVRGTVHGLKNAVKRMQGLLTKVVEREKTINRPGIPQYLQSTLGQQSVKSIEAKRRAYIEEVVENVGERPVKVTSAVGFTVKLTISIGDKFITKIVVGDITEYKVDAIVNAANNSLDHAGGVARSIVNKGGAEIQRECSSFIKINGPLLQAQLYVSKSGRLPCKAVIHAVGPMWSSGQKDEKNLLYETVFSILEEAERRSFTSVALPAISTGLYRFPLQLATRIILDAVKSFVQQLSPTQKLREVHIIDQRSDVISQFCETAATVFKDVDDVRIIHVSASDASSNEMAARPLAKPSRPPRSKFFSRKSSTSTSAKQSSLSDEKHQLLAAFPPSRFLSVVAGNKLQTSGNVCVTLIKGSLVKQEVDVLVNTTDKDLSLSGGAVSKLILSTAGPQIQAECKQLAPKCIAFGQVIETSGYSLPCKKVYHGACQKWDNAAGPCEATLRQFLKEVFRLANAGAYTSIAIPAVGTGVLHIPHALVAKWMYDEAEEFSRKNSNTSLRDVRFVVYDKNVQTVAAFEAELRCRGSGVKSRSHGRHLKKSDDFSVDAGGRWQKRLGSITLSVKQGDITLESTDAIVNSTNDQLELNRGAVSQAILSAAGPSIFDECKRFLELNPSWKSKFLAVTSPGQLPCKYIFHIAPEHGIERGVRACLEEAAQRHLSSITFPVLGTGMYGQKVSDVAAVMLETICKFSEKHQTSDLRVIQIVIFDASMCDGFAKALDSTVKNSQSQSWFRTFKQLFFSSPRTKLDVVETPRLVDTWQTGQPLDVVETATATAQRLHNRHSIRLRISALSTSDVEGVVQDLDTLCADVVQKHTIDVNKYGETISVLTDVQIACIQAIDNKFPVKVDIDTKSKKIEIQGQGESITSAVDMIHSILFELDKEARDKRDTESLSKEVQWMYQSDDSYEPYPEEINVMIEKSYREKKQSVSWEESDGRFEVDFVRMVEEKVGTAGSRPTVKVKRETSDCQLPKSWDQMTASESIKQVVLNPTSSEYKDVEQNITSSAGNTVHQIISIIRIQNPSMYRQYMVRRDAMQQQQAAASKTPVERILWHGTSLDTVESINKTGFNRSYCGKNAVVYGRGVYFAVQFSLSASNTYSVPDASGGTSNKHVYQSRVLTGDYTTGQTTYVVPPAKPGTTGSSDRYDSVVDNPAAPSIFVIFSDTQAYPEYLVIFK